MLVEKRSMLRPLVGSRSFYREALLVMLPVTGQQLLNSMFGFVDNLMVGMVDAASLSGVTVANKVFFVYSGFFWGLTGAAGLLISQFYGARDRKTCQILFSLQQVVGILIGLMFMGILIAVPRQALQLFVSDPATLDAGMSYVELIRYSYIPAGISMVSMFSLRAVGQARVSLFVGLLTISSNIFMNWVFIFGNLGQPAMGARGAALATLIARVLEMLIYFVIIAARRTYFSWNIGSLLRIRRSLIRMVSAKALPLIANEFMWTMGTNMFFWSYARLDESSLPALVIVEQSMHFVYVLFGGMSAAVSIMVGSRLGAGKFSEAKDNSNKMMFFMACAGSVMTIAALSVSNLLPGLFNVSDQLKDLAGQLIRLQAIFFLPNIIYTHIFFVLRAGGDIRSAFRLDAVYTWLVPIPAAVLMAVVVSRYLPVTIVAAFVITQTLLYSKLLLAFRFYRKGQWMQNLTLAGNQVAVSANEG